MKAGDLRVRSVPELQEQLMGLLKEQFNLRMQRGTGQLGRPSRMKEVRREIARIKTIMNELKSGGAQ